MRTCIVSHISAHEIRSWRDDRKKCGCAATKWIMNQEKK